MPIFSPPSYVVPLPFEHPPSYPTDPNHIGSQSRIAVADRHFPIPPGDFIKQSKGGSVLLRLNGQEGNAQLPVYGLEGKIVGRVELLRTDTVASVELKVEGTLHIEEIAERGGTSAKLCLNSKMLWSNDSGNTRCPHSLTFSLALPTAFTYESKSYPLPPSFHVELPGLPGFIATIEYSVSTVVCKRPTTQIPIFTTKSTGTTIVSTGFVYYPRSRPASPLPLPLRYPHTGFKSNSEWKLYESTLRSKSKAQPDLTMRLYIPASRTYCISQPIPFHLTVESPSSIALAMFLPFSPTGNSARLTSIQLIRQSVVDVKHELTALVRSDMWRTDCISKAIYNHVGDGPTSILYSGQIIIDESIKVTGFKAAGLSVKDCIVFTVSDVSKSAFHGLREVIPVCLVTDPWTPTTRIGASDAAWTGLW